MVNKTFVALFFLLTASMTWAEESEVINDWLINFDDTVCWATASITEDPFNDEYDSSEDFQFTVSFHNGDTVPQFTIISVTPGKTVTSATVKFKDDKFEYTVIEDTAFSLPEDDRDIIFNMLEGKVPYVLLSINNEDINPTPSVSLDGFKKAYNYISKICSFHKFPKALSGVS
ncbi:hypothetical protein OAH94_02275 [Amylibacter sp.]|nr:hypothetical protein [Amylibacter sp.]